MPVEDWYLAAEPALAGHANLSCEFTSQVPLDGGRGDDVEVVLFLRATPHTRKVVAIPCLVREVFTTAARRLYRLRLATETPRIAG